jgi:hypothetical protein
MRLLGSASNGSASVGNETSERQDNSARQANEAGSLLQPPLDEGVSAVECRQTDQSRRYPSDHDEVAQNPERPWRARNRCHRDQEEAKGDSDRGDEVERAGSDGARGDPGEARGHKNADSANGHDNQGDAKG